MIIRVNMVIVIRICYIIRVRIVVNIISSGGIRAGLILSIRSGNHASIVVGVVFVDCVYLLPHITFVYVCCCVCVYALFL